MNPQQQQVHKSRMDQIEARLVAVEKLALDTREDVDGLPDIEDAVKEAREAAEECASDAVHEATTELERYTDDAKGDMERYTDDAKGDMERYTDDAIGDVGTDVAVAVADVKKVKAHLADFTGRTFASRLRWIFTGK